jgi:hypothetical protein
MYCDVLIGEAVEPRGYLADTPLEIRLQPFHGENRGSIPLGRTSKISAFLHGRVDKVVACVRLIAA